MIEIWIDGACEPINPGGTGGWGSYVKKGDEVWWEGSGVIPASPETSNNVAEYMALLKTLEWALNLELKDEEILIQSDSKLVINQMFGTWRIKDGFYVLTAIQAKELLKKFSNIKGKWVPREANQKADELSKRELLKEGIKINH